MLKSGNKLGPNLTRKPGHATFCSGDNLNTSHNNTSTLLDDSPGHPESLLIIFSK